MCICIYGLLKLIDFFFLMAGGWVCWWRDPLDLMPFMILSGKILKFTTLKMISVWSKILPCWRDNFCLNYLYLFLGSRVPNSHDIYRQITGLAEDSLFIFLDPFCLSVSIEKLLLTLPTDVEDKLFLLICSIASSEAWYVYVWLACWICSCMSCYSYGNALLYQGIFPTPSWFYFGQQK
jgi:hypothetical protein